MAALWSGIGRFLELATAPRLQRVLFIDAPTVLGWQRWRELDARYGLGLLKLGLEQAQSSRQIRMQDTGLLGHLQLSVLIEAAMLVAQGARRSRGNAASFARRRRVTPPLRPAGNQKEHRHACDLVRAARPRS